MKTTSLLLDTAESGARPIARVVRERDDRRYFALGVVAIATVAMPVSLAGEGGLYLWHGLRVSSAVDALRMMVPALFGVVLVVLSRVPRLTRLGQSLLVLLSLLMAIGVFTDARVAFREAFQGLLEFVGQNALPAFLGLACIAAGSDLRLRGDTLRDDPALGKYARALLLAGVGLVVVLYVVPIRGTPLGVRIGESVLAAFKRGEPRPFIGLALFWLLGLWPLFCAVAALVAQRPRARPGRALGIAARYGLPGLTAVLCLRLLFDLDGHRVLLQLRSAMLLAVAIGAASYAVEAVMRHLFDAPLPDLPPPSMLVRDVRLRTLLRAHLQAGCRSSVLDAAGVPASHPWLVALMRRRLVALSPELPEPPPDPFSPDASTADALLRSLELRLEVPPPPAGAAARTPMVEPRSVAGWLVTGRRRLAVAIVTGAAALAALLVWRVVRPMPDLAWQLGPATAASDELFAELLPRYVVALGERNAALERDRSGGEAAQILRELSSEMLQVARDIDHDLEGKIAALVRDSDVVDESGQLWIDGVHGVNRRLRQLGLPYYVDGNVLELVRQRDGRRRVRRIFYVTTYRVETIHRHQIDGRPYAALHVRRIDHLNVEGSRLGMVRPDEPFALVILDVVERSAATQAEALSEGRCGLSAAGADALDHACGATLRAILARRGIDVDGAPAAAERALVAAQTTSTERHELQHQIDGDELAIPSALWKLVPWANESSLEETTKELSALLSELGGDDDLAAAASLSDVTSFATNDRRGRYHFAAVVIFGALAGAPVEGPGPSPSYSGMESFWHDVELHRDGLAAWLSDQARVAHDDLVDTPLLGPLSASAR